MKINIRAITIFAIALASTLIYQLAYSQANNSEVEIFYRNADHGATVMIKPVIELANISANAINLNDYSVRYWYTNEAAAVSQVLNMFFIQNTGNWQSPCFYPFACVNHTFGTVEEHTYLELDFSAINELIAPGKRFHMQFGINSSDWSLYDQSNDYSAFPTWNLISWDKITVYKNGSLIYGEEPVSDTSPPCFDESPGIVSTQLNPAVVNINSSGAVNFSATIPGPPTTAQVCLAPSLSAPCQAVIELDGPDDQCNYSTTLTAQQITQYFNPTTDVNRAVYGFLSAVNRPGRINLIANIYTPDIAVCTPQTINSTTQQCAHIVNLVMPEIFADNTQLISAKRRSVAQRMYETHADIYDFIDIVSVSRSYIQNRSYQAASNQIEGIGLGPFDITAEFGSAGMLKGTVIYPASTFFDGASATHSHELGHAWINFSDLPVLAQSSAHWPISSLANGIMGYSAPGGQGLSFNQQLEIIGGVVFASADTSPKSFKDLSLYAMGLLPSEEVTEHIVMNNAFNPNGFPSSEYSTFTIEDYIAANGERLPAYPNAQSSFRVATVLVSEELLDATTMSFFEYFASRMESEQDTLLVKAGLAPPSQERPFYSATGGRGSLNGSID